MFKSILFTLIFSSTSYFYGQEVISPSGNAYNNGGINLYWTIGETITTTQDDGNNIITQGFHQPQVTISTVKESTHTVFTVYPNPTTNYFTIEANNKVNSSAFLTDLNGKKIQSFLLNELKTQINIEEYPTGVYLLTIKENDTINTYKIIKK